jgi:ankyrin repeat protein
LLENNADVNQTGSVYQCQIFVRSDDVKEKLRLLSAAAHYGETFERITSLIAASARGHKTVVKILINAGSNLDAQVAGIGAALHVASWFGYKDIVRMLINAGADVNLTG